MKYTHQTHTDYWVVWIWKVLTKSRDSAHVRLSPHLLKPCVPGFITILSPLYNMAKYSDYFGIC